MKVVIGIQARTGSHRLPGKINMLIGGRPILQWVLDSCRVATRLLGGRETDYATIQTALLVPEGDPVISAYDNQVAIVEGDGEDVLSRYVKARDRFEADYVCRITADCPFIPAHHVAKHIRTALTKQRDYTTNVLCRTFKEGWDCEVLSERLLRWLDENARTPEEREHVTIKLQRAFPFLSGDQRPSICHILNLCDESQFKTSIDTKEELDAANAMYARYLKIKRDASHRGVYVT